MRSDGLGQRFRHRRSLAASSQSNIIAPSRRNNERNHISGMLLFTGAHFLAVLEGEEWNLGILWLRLERDQRHCDLFRIGDDLCGKRMYSEWMMAYMVDSKVDAQIESLRSLRGRFDMDGARAGTQADPVRIAAGSEYADVGANYPPHPVEGRQHVVRARRGYKLPAMSYERIR
jgi:hypothetical protein